MTDNTQTYHLKTLFSNYEKSFLMEHLVQYLMKIKRHLPQTQTLPQTQNFLNSDHILLQFESSPESNINAYELFPLQVMLWHTFAPSELFFTAKLTNSELFPNSYNLLQVILLMALSTLRMQVLLLFHLIKGNQFHTLHQGNS